MEWLISVDIVRRAEKPLGDGEKGSSLVSTTGPATVQTTSRRGSLQLWQFLVALLDTPDSSAGCIAWTGRGMEFKLIEPEEVMRSFLLFLNVVCL